MRITKKYLRTEIKKHNSKSLDLFKEAMYRYGDKMSKRGNYEYKILKPANYWNHHIDRIYFTKRTNELSLSIYWQGDHTDGFDEGIVKNMSMFIPAETEIVNGYTRFRHSDIKVSEEELWKAIDDFCDNYLK